MRLPFTTLMFLFSLTLFAQHERGNVYLSGETSLNHSILGLGEDESSNFTTFQAFRAGYFFTDRLLIGSQVSYFDMSREQLSFTGSTQLQFRPFARYYFPVSEPKKLSLFGELGFGRFNFLDDGDVVETDFFLGAGAEKEVLPGILGTISLRYDAFASGLNFTNLNFGLNVLLGQLENTGSPVSLAAGSMMIDPNFGALRYGRQKRGNDVRSLTDLRFSPKFGYALLDGLIAEVAFDAAYERADLGPFNTTTRNPFAGDAESTNIGFGVNLRYYPIQRGKLLPYATVGGGFSRFTSAITFSLDIFEERKINTQALHAGGGASYFLSPQLALDASIVYERESFDLESRLPIFETSPTNNFRFNTGLKIFLLSD